MPNVLTVFQSHSQKLKRRPNSLPTILPSTCMDFCGSVTRGVYKSMYRNVRNPHRETIMYDSSYSMPRRSYSFPANTLAAVSGAVFGNACKGRGHSKAVKLPIKVGWNDRQAFLEVLYPVHMRIKTGLSLG